MKRDKVRSGDSKKLHAAQIGSLKSIGFALLMTALRVPLNAAEPPAQPAPQISGSGPTVVCTPSKCRLIGGGTPDQNTPGGGPPCPPATPPAGKPGGGGGTNGGGSGGGNGGGVNPSNGKTNFSTSNYGLPSDFNSEAGPGTGSDENSRGSDCDGPAQRPAASEERKRRNALRSPGDTSNEGCGDSTTLLAAGQGTIDKLRPSVQRFTEHLGFDYITLNTHDGGFKTFRRYPFGEYFDGLYTQDGQSTPGPVRFLGVNGESGVVIATPPESSDPDENNAFPLVEYFATDGAKWTFFGFLDEANAPVDQTYLFNAGLSEDAAKLLQGQFWKMEKPSRASGSIALYTGDESTPLDAALLGFTNPPFEISSVDDEARVYHVMRVTLMKNSAGLEYHYEYESDDPRRLHSITMQIGEEGPALQTTTFQYYDERLKAAAIAQSISPPTAWPVREGNYSGPIEFPGRGGYGDLRLITVTTPLSANPESEDPAPSLVEQTYFRYYTQDEPCDTIHEHPESVASCHYPKAKIEPEGLRRAMKELVKTADELESISDGDLVKYAHEWYQPESYIDFPYTFYPEGPEGSPVSTTATIHGTRYLSQSGCGCAASGEPTWFLRQHNIGYIYPDSKYYFVGSLGYDPPWGMHWKDPYHPAVRPSDGSLLYRPDGTTMMSLIAGSQQNNGSILFDGVPEPYAIERLPLFEDERRNWQAELIDINSRGQAMAKYSPAALTNPMAFLHLGQNFQIKTDAGLITKFGYGFSYPYENTTLGNDTRDNSWENDRLPYEVQSVSVSKGSGGGAELLSSASHDTGTDGSGNPIYQATILIPPSSRTTGIQVQVEAAIPLPTVTKRFQNGSDSEDVTYVYDEMWDADGSDPNFLVKKMTMKTNVTTAHNGSDSFNLTTQYLYRDKKAAFTVSADGRWTYFEYNDAGQLSRRIDDVMDSYPTDAALTAAFTAFGITPSSVLPGDGEHIVTEMNYDEQGRLTRRTLPTPVSATPRAEEYRYFKTHDGRKITIGVPLALGTSSLTYYGPVSYRVENLAGKVEVDAELSLVGGNSVYEPTACYPGDTYSNPWLNIGSGYNVVSSVNTSVAKVSRLRVNLYTPSGQQLMESRVYHTIPTSAETEWEAWLTDTASSADVTKYQYDPMGRLARVEDPSGTVTRTVHDFRGLPIETWVGTEDKLTAGSGSPWPIGNGRTTAPGSPASGFNMTKIASYEYIPGEGVSEGWLSKKTEYAGDGSDRVTQYLRDYRGRVIVEQHLDPSTSDPLDYTPRILRKYDLQGRVIAEATYSTAAALDEATDPLTYTDGRMSLKEMFYDERGQVWKTVTHRIAQKSETVGENSYSAGDIVPDFELGSLFRYDPVGRLIKTIGTNMSKVRYDRLGRVLRQWSLAMDGTGLDDGAMKSYTDDYADGTGTIVSTDAVLELHQNVYEERTGNLIGTINVSRSQAEKTNIASISDWTLGDLHYDNSVRPLSITPGNVKGRLQLTTYFYDDWNRRTTTAFYGTAGFTDYKPAPSSSASTGTAPDVPGTEPTVSGVGVIWSLNAYNAKGELETVTDPDGKVTKTFYDGAGRVTKTIRNRVNDAPGGGTYNDQDQVVEYAYTDGLLTSMTALNEYPQTGSTQTQATSYVYGTTKGTLGSGSPGASLIATGHLLRETVYPVGVGGSGDRTVYAAYNAIGEPAWTKDQLGNEIKTDRDHAGRVVASRVTGFGSAYDPVLHPTYPPSSGMTAADVIKIAILYDNRSLVEKVTQYGANISTPDDNPIDQVKYSYDDFGLVTEFRQQPSGAINPSTPDGYAVGFTNSYSAPLTGRAGVRRTGLVLPGLTTSGKHNASALVTYNFGVPGDLNDLVGRVETVDLTDSGGVSPVTIGAAEYSYLGASMLAGSKLTEPGFTNRMYADGPTATNFYVVTGLDRFNRVSESRWGRVISGPLDWYAYRTNVNYDAASSITSTQDRVVPATDVLYTNDDLHRLVVAQEGKLASGSISDQLFKQNWSLSLTGNWLGFDETVGIDAAPISTRTETRTNNAVNEIATRTVDSSPTSFVYNKAGQLIDDGVKIYTYDAWGRLRYVHARDDGDRGDVIEESRYNGLGYRIAYHSDQDLDADIDGSDPWMYNVYDDSWRTVAVFKAGSDVNHPHERYVYHAAGMDGGGRSSYIDDAILRERDDDVLLAGTASDSLTDRMYYLQNWRHDVSVLVRQDGIVLERPRYTSYGVARTATIADFDHDGQVSDSDFVIFNLAYTTLIIGYAEGETKDTDSEAWGVCDLNQDGLVDDGDFALWNPHYTDVLGVTPGEVSNRSPTAADNVDNRIGYAGYSWSANTAVYHVRHRVYDPMTGIWTTRDPIGYQDGSNLYEYVKSSSVKFWDPAGLACEEQKAMVAAALALQAAEMIEAGAACAAAGASGGLLMPLCQTAMLKLTATSLATIAALIALDDCMEAVRPRIRPSIPVPGGVNKWCNFSQMLQRKNPSGTFQGCNELNANNMGLCDLLTVKCPTAAERCGRIANRIFSNCWDKAKRTNPCPTPEPKIPSWPN